MGLPPGCSAPLGGAQAPLATPKRGGNTSSGAVQGFRGASHLCTWVQLQRGRGHQVGALLSHGSGSLRGLGTPGGLCSHSSRWRDSGGASGPSVNYLASMFINQQFLCKQTHPELCFPSPWQQHRADPGSGCAPGSHLGHSPRLKLFACSFFLPQRVFRPWDLLSIGFWASPSLNPGPPCCGITDLPTIVSRTFELLDPSLNPGVPHNLILELSIAGFWTS